MFSGSEAAPDFSGWRVGELRRYLHERGVSTAGALKWRLLGTVLVGCSTTERLLQDLWGV